MRTMRREWESDDGQYRMSWHSGITHEDDGVQHGITIVFEDHDKSVIHHVPFGSSEEAQEAWDRFEGGEIGVDDLEHKAIKPLSEEEAAKIARANPEGILPYQATNAELGFAFDRDVDMVIEGGDEDGDA